MGLRIGLKRFRLREGFGIMNKQATNEQATAINKYASLIVLGIWGTFIAISFLAFKSHETLPEYRPIVVSSVSRSLNTSYQPSVSRYVSVSCSVSITSTLSLSGGQSGSIMLQSSPDNITFTTIATATNNNTGTLTNRT